MGLVTAKEVAKVANLSRFGALGTFMAWTLLKVTKLSDLGKWYDTVSHLEGRAFLDAALEYYEIDYEIPVEDLKRLPKEGPYITVSNHPLGVIDGIILMQMMLRHRPDFKIMTNFLLQRFEPMKPYIFPVNPFEDRKGAKSSLTGFKNAMLHLKDGHPFGIFPAGEVSTRKEGKIVVDKEWDAAAIKLIQRAGVPVVPIYFHARNSPLFYRLAKMNDTFRTAKLPSEVYSQKYRPIKVRIGQPISVATQNEQSSLKEYSELLRRKTYILANAYEKERLIDQLPTTLKLPKQPRKIVKAVRTELIENEIKTLVEKDRRMVQSKNYEVFLAPANEIPFTLQEIGRQREITFREIGEGTNNSIDIDKFDAYYHHMFL
ncbi:MAG: 1-acyl-sn-glycerol-3-phosphate acyltransferase, partial [Pricia sp.]